MKVDVFRSKVIIQSNLSNIQLKYKIHKMSAAHILLRCENMPTKGSGVQWPVFASKTIEALEQTTHSDYQISFWQNLDVSFKGLRVKTRHCTDCFVPHAPTSTPWSKWELCMTWPQRPYLHAAVEPVAIHRAPKLWEPATAFAQSVSMPHLFWQDWRLANQANPCVEVISSDTHYFS